MKAKSVKSKDVLKVIGPRVPSGIPGFDTHLGGGLIPLSVNLISGGTGTGKTIFCMQYLFSGAKDYGETGLYLSFEETEDALKADVKQLGIDLDMVPGKVKIVYVSPYDVRDFIPLLSSYLQQLRPKRVVLDSLSALEMHMEDDFERKKQIYKINELLKKFGCTSLLISEIPSENAMGSETVARFSKFGIEEFLCDGVIALYYAGIGGESDRAIRIIKQRRSDHTRSPIPMTIGQGGLKLSTVKY